MLVLADMLLTMSVYVLIPIMPLWLMNTESFSPLETGLSMGAYAIGLYLLGAQCSWLVQRYRRNVVCMWSIVFVGLSVALLWYIDDLRSEFVEFWVIVLQRLLMGAAFGLAQMVLSSTLIIDTCESFHRTEANHSAAWFARFALSLAPMGGIMGYQMFGFDKVLWGSIGCALLSVLLIRNVTFPFRAPEENVHVASLDRFLLPNGTVLFFNQLLVTLVVGLVLSQPLNVEFYAMLMGGFLLALLAQRFVFRDADLKSEIVSGLFLLIAALLIQLIYPTSPIAPLLMGLSVGIIGARYLLFFIKLSRHCKRGTSHSTFFLSWETGITLGLATGYAWLYGERELLFGIAIGLTVLSLVLYHFYTHNWFLKHKNR
jgi:hypothetical protein